MKAPVTVGFAWGFRNAGLRLRLWGLGYQGLRLGERVWGTRNVGFSVDAVRVWSLVCRHDFRCRVN